MTDTQIYKRYTVVSLITMAALFALTVALDVLLGIDAGSGVGIVSVLVPALDAGQSYARKTSGTLEKPRMWRLAVVFTLINLGLGVMVLFVVLFVIGTTLLEVLYAVGPVGFLIISGVLLGIYILAARFFLGFGVRTELKRQEKLRG